MIEIPEAIVLAHQLNETVKGKPIRRVIAAQSPHKLAWYQGAPDQYPALLEGKTMGSARGIGSFVEMEAQDAVLLLSEGVNLRFHRQGETHPKKHQLLLEFEDGTAVSASVQMYGGLLCFPKGGCDNKYYQLALEIPSPMTEAFSQAHFHHLLAFPGVDKLSLKAFLATEQRIPGLGNGVLQDILFYARLHPKRKISTLTREEQDNLYGALLSTLAEMTALGGRDTEKDLFGNAGGYGTKMSKNTANKPCQVCGTQIKKEAYMGGSVYYCPECQPA